MHVGLAEKYQTNLEKGLAPLVDGPLLVATTGQPVGSMASLFRAEAFNLATTAIDPGGVRISGRSRGKVHQAGLKDVRLPTSFAVAITPTSVYFYKWKPFWGRVKIKKQLLAVPRDGLTVSITKGRATTTVIALQSETAGVRTAFEIATLGMSKAKDIVAGVVAAFEPEVNRDT